VTEIIAHLAGMGYSYNAINGSVITIFPGKHYSFVSWPEMIIAQQGDSYLLIDLMDNNSTYTAPSIENTIYYLSKKYA
jgi:hypothetical protein